MLRDEAKRYFSMGLNVVLLRDKKPLHRWQHLLNERQTEEEFNALPWEGANQFAVLCGKKANNGLYFGAIDIDVKNLPAEVAEKALTIMRSFPTTQTEKTPSGGYHLVFWSVKPVKTISQYHNVCGVELIGEGKLCVMHPSKGYSKVNDNLPSEVDDLTGLFFEVLAEHGIIPQKAADESDELLERWLRQIKAKLKVKSEGARYISCSCPFHPPDRHPSFAINKQRYYAVDYHTGEVYSLKELAEKLGITLEHGSPIIKELEKHVQDALVEDEYILRAKRLFEVNPYFYDSFTGFFYVYDHDEGVYVQKDDDEVLAFFFDFLDPDLKKSITSSVRKNRLLQAFKIIGLKNQPKKPPKTWIKVKNGIVDMETGELRESTPEYFFVNAIPWKLGESEETPTIDKLFSSWVKKENKKLLYEIAAYSLLRDYPIHRIFILYGSGRNGKGSFLRLLVKFLGKRNCVSTDIERLESSRFETSRLYQKLLAICAETNYATIEKSATLKALCGQDLIPAEYKFKNRFEYENYAKLIIATNNLPQSLDTSDGFFSRVIIIDFPNVFDEGKDVIVEIPEKEFENLLKKCIRILRELLERGRFTNEGTIEEKRERYEERANPLKTFIEEYCEFNPEGFIPSTEFYNRFKAWMIQKRPRFRIPSWKNEVKPMLESMGLETGIQKRIGDERPRCIIGLKWKEKASVSEGSEVLSLRILPPTLINKSETRETSETRKAWIGFEFSSGCTLDMSRLKSVKRLDRVLYGFCDGCCVANSNRKTALTFKAETFDGVVLLLCEDCGRTALKALRERDGCAG